MVTDLKKAVGFSPTFVSPPSVTRVAVVPNVAVKAEAFAAPPPTCSTSIVLPSAVNPAREKAKLSGTANAALFAAISVVTAEALASFVV